MVTKFCLVFTLLFGTATCGPVQQERALLVTRDSLDPEYDFIVAGAGTAGLTVADRLSENGTYSVLVVEYGYYDLSNSITATSGPPSRRTQGPEYYPTATRYYNITSQPLPGLYNRTMAVIAGCVVGGSSAVNGQFFGRGSAEDYDAWVWAAGKTHEAEFGREWGWENILPWFRKSVTFHPPTPEVAAEYEMTYSIEEAYGGSTPIHSSYPPFQWPAQRMHQLYHS
jgi:choline dehydrogenase-like flavoprotein